jgi:hypothetical protein
MQPSWRDRATFKPLSDEEIEKLDKVARAAYETREVVNAMPLMTRARKRQRKIDNKRDMKKATRNLRRSERARTTRTAAIRVKTELALDKTKAGSATQKNLLASLKQLEESLGKEGRRELAKKATPKGGKHKPWSQLDKGTKVALLTARSQR